MSSLTVGSWADPFGPMVDPTSWHPMQDGENRYALQVALNQAMNLYGADFVKGTNNADGSWHWWIVGQVQQVSGTQNQYVMAAMWLQFNPENASSASSIGYFQSSVSPSSGTQVTKQQVCQNAKATVASLWQQSNSQEAVSETKTFFKELGAGATIGCVIGASGAIATVVGAPLAPGACAAGAIEGTLTAAGVYALSHVSLLGQSLSNGAQLATAAAQAVVACR
jgi:hypothetical protein